LRLWIDEGHVVNDQVLEPFETTERRWESLDGAKVAMYSQWRSMEDYQAMRTNAAALPFMQQALALAKFDPGMYEVVEIFEPLPKDS
jgi:hypothetical protein